MFLFSDLKQRKSEGNRFRRFTFKGKSNVWKMQSSLRVFLLWVRWRHILTIKYVKETSIGSTWVTLHCIQNLGYFRNQIVCVNTIIHMQSDRVQEGLSSLRLLLRAVTVTERKKAYPHWDYYCVQSQWQSARRPILTETIIACSHSDRGDTCIGLRSSRSAGWSFCYRHFGPIFKGQAVQWENRTVAEAWNLAIKYSV